MAAIIGSRVRRVNMLATILSDTGRSGLKDAQSRVNAVKSPQEEVLRGAISEHVELGSQIYTDALKSYRRLTLDGFIHDFIDHAESYVEGAV
jgi:transposase-like protein